MALPDSQNGLNSIRDRTVELFQKKKLSDCSFRVGQAPNQRVFDAHKLILSIASPSYEAMFYGALAEKKYPIDVPDVEPESFAIFMEYLYTDRVHIDSVDRAIAVCSVAHTYMVTPLVKHCTIFCQKNLCTDNVCRIYEFTKRFDLMDLRERCVEMIRTNINVILENPGFVDIEISTLVDIFHMDYLNLDRELRLYNALERYTNANEQQPKDCGEYRELLKTVRYLSMTPEEFAKGPGYSKLLKEDEKLAILMNISCKCHKDYHMPEGFRTDKRHLNNSLKRGYQ